MQYSCGKININIPDGYGDIKDIVFSAHIIVRYNNGHCGGIDPHIIGLCKKQIRRMSLYPILIIVSRDSNPNHSYLSQLDVTYKTPDLMSHFLPPHEVSFTFCCSSIVFPR
ncbi:glycosyltransferase involved exopolysaccharide (EPS) synthesis [Streptococcus pneumoniae]|nr:glycosyltransferase involved exopolysaccharide (EPS) synthesis [Streptococcus pneumoniae]